MKDLQKLPPSGRPGDEEPPTPAIADAPLAPFPLAPVLAEPAEDHAMGEAETDAMQLDGPDAPGVVPVHDPGPRGGAPFFSRPTKYVHDPTKHLDPKDQVKYGPGEGLTVEDQLRAYSKIYDGQTPAQTPEEMSKSRPMLKKRPGQKKDDGSAIFERATQYNKSHGAYLAHAHRTGRPLTIEEMKAQESGHNTEGASINHIIASGVGQNTLNQGLANFKQGEDAMPKGPALDTARGTEDGRKVIAKSLAQQAAAVGRTQMYNRGIAFENHKKPNSLDQTEEGMASRHQLLKDTVALMTHGGLDRYERLLKETFDSPGNLRVGDGPVNGVVSTGLDVELTPQSVPTERSQRLMDLHLAAAPDHDAEVWTTYQRSTAVPLANRGAALSSSMEAPNPAMTDTYLAPEPAPVPSFGTPKRAPRKAGSGRGGANTGRKATARTRRPITDEGKIDMDAKRHKRADDRAAGVKKKKEEALAASRRAKKAATVD